MVKIHLSAIMGKERITQAELSRRTGIRYNTINDLYHELALGIRFEHLERICEVLDCDFSDLIEYIPDKKKAKK